MQDHDWLYSPDCVDKEAWLVLGLFDLLVKEVHAKKVRGVVFLHVVFVSWSPFVIEGEVPFEREKAVLEALLSVELEVVVR